MRRYILANIFGYYFWSLVGGLLKFYAGTGHKNDDSPRQKFQEIVSAKTGTFTITSA
jgi:hypothetical protein